MSPGAEVKGLKGQCVEAEAHKGPITCPKPHSISVVELGPFIRKWVRMRGCGHISQVWADPARPCSQPSVQHPLPGPTGHSRDSLESHPQERQTAKGWTGRTRLPCVPATQLIVHNTLTRACSAGKGHQALRRPHRERSKSRTSSSSQPPEGGGRLL